MACVRKRRGKWVVDWRDGGNRRHWKSFDRKKDAEAFRDTVSPQAREGRRYDARRLFLDVAADYERAHVDVDLGPASKRDHERLMRLHVTPFFERTKLVGVDVKEIEAFKHHLVANGVGNRTVNKALQVVGAICRYAVEHDEMSFNPVQRVRKMPAKRVTNVEQNVLAPSELTRLLGKAEGPFRTMLLTATLTGIRLGELMALGWEAVDLDNRQLHVVRSWDHAERQFIPPKTEHSRRRVDLSPVVVRELRAWKLQSKPGEELVFPGEDGPLTPGALRRRFRRALKRAGLAPRRWHDLRHTYASLQLANGASLVYVSRQLGHTSPNITLGVYSHLLQESDAAAADRLEAFALGSKTVAELGEEAPNMENVQAIQ